MRTCAQDSLYVYDAAVDYWATRIPGTSAEQDVMRAYMCRLPKALQGLVRLPADVTQVSRRTAHLIVSQLADDHYFHWCERNIDLVDAT